MTESEEAIPTSIQERRLKRMQRIEELQEKLRHQAAAHLYSLEEKGLLDEPRLLLVASNTDGDITKTRQHIWETAGELLRLDGNALTAVRPLEVDE